MNRFKVSACMAWSDSLLGKTVQVRIWDPAARGRGLPVQFKVLTPEEDGLEFQPVLTLMPEEAQALMDELWDCGLRPREGIGSAGSLAATERHLADMRALVFKTKPRDAIVRAGGARPPGAG